MHLAKLHGGNGETVAIKVQHPNLGERLALDMAILRYLASFAARLAPDMRIGETADQFALNFEAQLDFRDEARNLEKFSSNFSSSFWSAVVSFPQPIKGLVSHDVLVETFEDGESVAKYLHRAGTREVGEWRQVRVCAPIWRRMHTRPTSRSKSVVPNQSCTLTGTSPRIHAGRMHEGTGTWSRRLPTLRASAMREQQTRVTCAPTLLYAECRPISR